VHIDFTGLRLTLEDLARSTWTDIADGRRLSVGMGETGVTDRNMLALRRRHPSLIVHKHSAQEEVRSGADWEWWLGGDGRWTCLVFQAKLLSAAQRYVGVTKGIRDGKPQVDSLLQSCLDRSERLQGAVWPLYCFYNSWPGTWPKHVTALACTNPGAASQYDLPLYGCAVADAWHVRHVLFDRDYANRRTLRDSYLPISRPWSAIFGNPGRRRRLQLGGVGYNLIDVDERSTSTEGVARQSCDYTPPQSPT
jgi:hypothetical protein